MSEDTLMHNVDDIPQVTLDWPHTFRAIPSKYPPINFFEDLVDASLMEALYHVESLTNDRLRDETGDISLVATEDRISGTGSSVIMAAFTHISTLRPSRFSDGTFGIYYAGKNIETALKERMFHSALFLSYTNEPPGIVTLRVYQSKAITKPLRDIRGDAYQALHQPSNYAQSQQCGDMIKKANYWGLVYHSVRHQGGECVAIFRPPAIPLPVNQTKHYHLAWDGAKITAIYEVSFDPVLI